MVTASELHPGLAVRVEGVLYKVVAADYHGGGGKMGGVTHAKLRGGRNRAIRRKGPHRQEAMRTPEFGLPAHAR